MIDIKILNDKKTNFFKKILVSGHSEFSSSGNDIICSAVSAIVFGSFAFFKSSYQRTVFCDKFENLISFSIEKFDREIDLLFLMMTYQLENISNFYPNQVRIHREKS